MKVKLQNILPGYPDPNVIFYLSTPPMLYKIIADHLAAHDLNVEENGWKRMIIEKPFGYDLETAQKNKYQKLIDLLHIKDGNKILEIGCGWGGFSEYLAKKQDVIIDCITISKKQYDYTKKRIFKNNLNNKVNVMFLDYRDLKDKYDKIASIEMIEAVGDKYLSE